LDLKRWSVFPFPARGWRVVRQKKSRLFGRDGGGGGCIEK
jgi:hypothetical protein